MAAKTKTARERAAQRHRRRPMADLPLDHVLRERDAPLAEMWLVREVEWLEPMEADPYGDADFELSVRELLCDTAAKVCRGQG